jgi:plasmid stability protein
MSKTPGLARRKIHIDLPAELHQQLKVKAALEGVSIQAFVTRLVEAAVEGVHVPARQRKAQKER